jgi:hypothetical protein
MNSRALRRSRRTVASTLDDGIDKIEEAGGVVGDDHVGTAGHEVRAEIAALPEQLKELRHAIVTGIEPYRPPRRHRPYVQLGVGAMIMAAMIAIVVRRRYGADRGAATAPDRPDYRRTSDDDAQSRPSSLAHATKPESEG